MTGYLADTSVFRAAERGRLPQDPPPGDARISVATLTELIVRVHRARDRTQLTLRAATLARARAFVPLACDELVAQRLAGLLAAAGNRGEAADTLDAIVAATALVHDLAVWTRNDDFEKLTKLAPDLRVHRG